MTDVASTRGPTDASELRRAFEKRYGELVHHVAESVPAEELAEALAANDPYTGLAEALGAAATMAPPRDPLAAARARSVGTRMRLLERAGGAFRVGEAADLLGISAQAVQARRNRGTILAIPLPNGEHVYPACQFDESGVIAGLKGVLAAFHDIDPWTQLSVLLAASERFGGKSALDLLRTGDAEGALRIAATFGEHVA